MARRDLRSVLVRMSPTLKRRLAREVGRSKSTLNDIAVEILAQRYGVAFERSGRKGSVPGDTGDVLLRVPPELKNELDADARERGQSMNDVIVEELSERLDATVSRRKERMAQQNGSQNGKGRAVGKDLADAIWAKPNDTIKFADVPSTGVTVSRGMTHDGLGKYLSQVVEKAPGDTDDVSRILHETGTDVVVNFLPVGSEEATKWYAEQILNAGCAMVNCMPVFIAKGGYFRKRFEDRGLPIIGDDIKSQVGATITHRALTQIFRDRGVRLDRTMQLNVGGNSDFLNMLERERLESKKVSKTNAVTSVLDYDLGPGN